MGRQHMDIVYICDEKYVLSTLISIRSLKKNGSKGWSYHITVIADELSACSVQELLAEMDEERIVISVYRNSEEFEDISFEHSYVTRSALLKL